MHQQIVLFAIGWMAAFFIQTGQAAEAELADELAEVDGRLRVLYPATKFTQVSASPINGLYEVVMGKNIAYTDRTGRYFLFGHLFDMNEQKDMTAELIASLNKINISTLPLDDAIEVVQGQGERKLFIFSDPDCPYCRRLEEELPKLDNVTIHTFLYPIRELHPQASEKARWVWCTDDRAAAWEALMRQGRVPEEVANDCQDPIARTIELAKRLGIEATPTLILSDGTLLPGYRTASELEAMLEGVRK